MDTVLEMCDGLFSRVCIKLVTEDAVNKKRCGHEERHAARSGLMWSYSILLQLLHSIVTCVCIHMMRVKAEQLVLRAVRVMMKCTNPPHISCSIELLLCVRLFHFEQTTDSELFEQASVVSDQIHDPAHYNPLIELRAEVESVCEWPNPHSSLHVAQLAHNGTIFI